MSCLTKISLFFLVLTILCNPTFSDIFSECMGSVHEVFKEDVSPVKHFKIALYSLSKKLILSKNGTQEYMTFYEQNAGVISEFGPFFAGKHDETLTYFRLLERLVSPINLPPESKRSYVLGYFNLLIDHFYNSDPSMNNIPSVDNSIIEFNKTTVNNYVITPERYCIGRGIFEPSCQEALTRMLRDPQQPDNDPSNMDGYQILKYCYKKLTHLDFTLEKYYLANVIDAVDIPFYKIQLQTMASYLAYISDMAESIVDHCVDNGFRFPTILQFCTARSST